MGYAVFVSFVGGLFSRRWAGLLTLLGGIVTIYGVFHLAIYLAIPEVERVDAAFALGMGSVEAAIILLAGLIPFTLRRLFRRRENE